MMSSVMEIAMKEMGQLIEMANTKLKILPGPIINVAGFGAVGDWDGSSGTDDTEAVQRAIDEAVDAGMKTVFFPHGVTGVYRVTELTNVDQVVFIGDNALFSGVDSEIIQFGLGASQEDIAEINARIDNIVGQTGESNTEIVDARKPVTGPAYPTLKGRLDAEYTAQSTAINTEKSNRIAADVATNSRIDNLILESGGDSNLEVVDARVDRSGEVFPTLKQRLDHDSESAGLPDGYVTDVKLSDDTGQIKERFATHLLETVTGIYNVKTGFGAKGDTVHTPSFASIPVGTDDTAAIQSAATAAINGTLYIPKGKYLITDTLIFDGVVEVIAELGAEFIGKISNKTKPIIRMGGNKRGVIRNLTIYGCGYLPLAGIHFSGTDNQALELNNVKVANCRYGLYVNQGEIINRMVINRCDFTSNLLAGVWCESYTSGSYAHSAPITFIHTLINGNGIPSFLTTDTEYDGTMVLESTDKYGLQIYMKGFVNLSFIGGQISGHTSPKNLALAHFENGSGVTLQGVDIEDIQNPVKTDGTPITDFDVTYAYNEGAAVVFSAVNGVKISQIHCVSINTKSMYKFNYGCGDVHVDVVDLFGTAKYLMETFGAITGVSSNLTRIFYDGDLTKLTPDAFKALDKSKLTLLTHVSGGITPNDSMNWIFDVFKANATNYQIGYWSNPTTPDLTQGCYIEKKVNNASVIYALLECTQNTSNTDGVFFIEALDNTGTRLGFTSRNFKGEANLNGYYYAAMKYLLPTGTQSVRYGVVNSANYTGVIPTNATFTGFTVYAGYQNPVLSDIAMSDNLFSRKQGETWNRNSDWGKAAPTTGTYVTGFTRHNSAPTLVKNISHWRCITGGSPGTWVAYGCGQGTTANRPTLATGDAGYSYFDTTLNKMIAWSGSTWLV